MNYELTCMHMDYMQDKITAACCMIIPGLFFRFFTEGSYIHSRRFPGGYT